MSTGTASPLMLNLFSGITKRLDYIDIDFDLTYKMTDEEEKLKI